MKIFKKIVLFLLIVFIVAQFFGPNKNQGDVADLKPFFEDTKPCDVVETILYESCFDCHSSNTRYPWYSHITPINYWMASHIKEGRQHLDFSKWDSYSLKKKDHKIEELIEMVENLEMPLPSYVLGHPKAKLSNKQIDLVVEWGNNMRKAYTLKMERPQ